MPFADGGCSISGTFKCKTFGRRTDYGCSASECKGDERTGLADKNSQLKTDSVILIFRTHTRKELEKGSFFIACI